MGKFATVEKDRIMEALEILDDVAKEKRDEIRDLIQKDFRHIRRAVSDLEEPARDLRDRLNEYARELRHSGGEQARDVARRIDREVHSHPWAYMTGLGVSSLVLGFVLGRKR